MSDSNNADADLLKDLQLIMADRGASAAKTESHKAKLKSERLEERVLFSATWADAPDMSSGTNYVGTSGNDVHTAGDGSDLLSGLAGNDTLRGGLGDDRIIGGTGNDSLFGDAGNDTFVYREGDGTDRFNGGDGLDVVDGSEAQTLSMLHMTATDSIESVLGQASGTRIVGTADANQFDFRNTTLKNISEIDAGAGNDSVQGSQSNDVIFGGAGNDTLYGNGGNDVLTGGTGNDSLFGNDGDDLFVYSQGDGADRFNGGKGFDTVDARGATNFGLLHMTASDSVESIVGRDGGTRIEGTTAANQFDFSKTSLKNVSEIDAGAGNDTVRASQGNDVIYGGTGNDNLFGNGGDDKFVYRDGDGTDRFNGGSGYDVVSATGANKLGLLHATASDSIEAIIGREGGTRIEGTAAANQFDFRKTTLKNVSEIDAGAGNDIVYGSSLDDTILASAGNDRFFGDAGKDTVKFTGKFSDYRIAPGSSGSWTVQDLRAGSPDGTDTIQSVEKFQFADGFADVDKAVNFFPNQLEINGNSVAENSPAGTVVVQFGSNPAVTKNFRFELVDASGNSIENSDFAVVGNQIVVKTGANIDFESSNSRELNVRVIGANGSNYITPIRIDITNVNENPMGQSFHSSATEDSAFQGNVLQGSSDVDGDRLQVSSFSQPSHGVVVVDQNGEFRYKPADNFHGTDSFTYTISDGNGGTFTEKVAIDVSSVNDAPVGQTFALETSEDSGLTGNVLQGSSDVDGDQLQVSSFSQPSHGVVVVDQNGEFRYKPADNFHGTDSFTYTISDGNGGTFTEKVVIEVSSVNDAPVGQTFALETSEDSGLTGNVLQGSSDVDGDELQVSSFSQPSHGVVVVDQNGEFRYKPADNFHGTDSFTYTISDGNGGTFTEKVVIEVSSVNDAPVGQTFALDTSEDSGLTGNVLQGSSDVDGDQLQVSSFSQPSHGVVVVDSNGEFRYKPADNFHGTDLFTYTINDGNGGTFTEKVVIEVSSVNDAPVGQTFALETSEDSGLTGNVLQGSSDVDGDQLQVSSFSQPSHGVVVVDSNGEFSYRPADNFHGTDSFTYTISDGNGGTFTERVVIEVSSVNDAPVGQTFALETSEDSGLTGNVLQGSSDVDGDRLQVSSFSQPSHGVVVVDQNGEFRYKPADNFHGTDSFTYTISDGNGGTFTEKVAIDVSSVNDAPVGQTFALETSEDSGLTGNVLQGSSDVDGDQLQVSSFSQPSHGVVVVDQNGEFRYKPADNFHGTDSFTYTISDGNGGTFTEKVVIEVSSVNDAPVGQTFALETSEDSGLTGNVLQGSSDVDGDELQVSSFSQPSHGVVVVDQNGEFRYKPADNFHGTDSFTYTISDGNGGTFTEKVVIEVSSVNDAPVGQTFALDTSEDSGLTGNVLQGSSDVDGDQLQVSSFSQPSHGVVVVDSNGEFRYKPADNFHGTDLFTYTINDGNGGTFTEKVVIEVSSVNDAPVGQTFALETSEDSGLTGNVLQGSSDVDGDQLQVSSFSQPSHGVVVVDSNGEFSYRPADNFHGTDSFTYTISDGNGGTFTERVVIEVSSVNDAPVGQTFALETSEDSGLTGNVLQGSSDVDGDQLQVSSFSQPSHGVVVVDNNGEFRYKPADNFHGTDSFTYTISDGNGGTFTEKVVIEVSSVNDAPVGQTFALETSEDSGLTGNVLQGSSDVDGDQLQVSSFSQPSHGVVVVDNNGEFRYKPADNFHGTDSFTYTISDGNGGTFTEKVVIEVSSVNDAPVGQTFALETSEDSGLTGNVLQGSSDVDGDQLQVSSFSQPSHGVVVVDQNGEFRYKPADNFHGTDSFTYTISDGNGGTFTEKVAIDVSSVNDAPVGQTFALETSEDSGLTGNVLQGSSDVDGDELQVSSFSQPSHGVVVVDNNGEFRYKPADNFHGTDSFTYTISDGNGGTFTEKVVIEVSSVNDAPVGQTFALETSEDSGLTGNVLQGSSDVDGDQLQVSSFSQPSHGVVVVDQNGEFRYKPADNFHGTDSFTYTISDGNGGTFTEKVVIEVSSVNDAPVGQTFALETSEDSGLTGNVLQGSSDVDGDQLQVSSFSQPSHGVVVVDQNGEFSYRPADNFHGTDTFTYTINDGNGGTFTEKVVIEVSSVNDAPTTTGYSFTLNEDGSAVGNLLDNAVDVDGDRLVVNDFTQPAYGEVVVDADGSFIYLPAADFSGTDSFTYVVSDGNGGQVQETVVLTVKPVADGVMIEMLSVSGQEHQPMSLDLSLAMKDVDGSEVIKSVLLKNVPPAATLSAGVYQADGSWQLTAQELNGLTMQFDRLGNEDFDLTVEVSTQDGESERVQAHAFSVDVRQDALLATMFQQFLAGVPVVEFPTIDEVENFPAPVSNTAEMDPQSNFQFEPSSEVDQTYRFETATDVWNDAQWERVQHEFSGPGLEWTAKSDHQADQSDDAESMGIEQPLYALDLGHPQSLQMEEGPRYSASELAELSIELDHWETFIDSGEVNDTSKLTAASLLTLFTIKEDNRRKLRGRHENSSNNDKLNGNDQ